MVNLWWSAKTPGDETTKDLLKGSHLHIPHKVLTWMSVDQPRWSPESDGEEDAAWKQTHW